jgi:hypothetical protein
MGYRTVVILNNDLSSSWQNDPMLGKKISDAAGNLFASKKGWFDAGNVLEVAHADTNTLAVIESFSMDVLARSNWHADIDPTVRAVDLVRDAADRLGYKLVKKAKR